MDLDAFTRGPSLLRGRLYIKDCFKGDVGERNVFTGDIGGVEGAGV